MIRLRLHGESGLHGELWVRPEQIAAVWCWEGGKSCVAVLGQTFTVDEDPAEILLRMRVVERERPPR